MDRLVKYCLATIALLCAFSAPLLGQTNKEALAASRSGYEFEQQNKFSEAIFEYNKAIAADPKYPYPVERIGAMYQHLHNYPRAIQFLRRAIALDSNFDDYNLYNLGTCYQAMQKTDSAVMYFQNFVAKIKPVVPDDSAAVRDAMKLISFNEQCLGLKAKPKNTKDPIPLNSGINSPYDDFSPTVSPDGKSLYFTSRRQSTNSKIYAETNDYGDDIFFSSLGPSGWSSPLVMPTPVNSKDDEGAVSISADGQTVFYSLCRRSDGMGDCDLYYSELNGLLWSAPRNLGRAINSSAWDAQPSISADGLTMYFSSRRIGSVEGSEDIWVAYKNTDGTWGQPVNLGSQINTPLSERSPFIANDGRTLYFSSNGRPGFGGHDLFMTRKQPDGSWTEPKNLGSPINTGGDDEFMTIPARGDKIYFASQRDNTKSRMDIYEAILPTDLRPLIVTLITGNVFDKNTKKPLGAKIELTDLAADQILAEYHSNTETGEFQIPVPPGKNYGFTATAPHYAFFSKNYSTSDTALYHELHYEIALTRIDSEIVSITPPIAENPSKDTSGKIKNSVVDAGNGDTTVIELSNIFFDFNKATLRPESISELRHMLKFMQDYPKLKIEISGHTDSVGTDEANRKLSQGRAESVREYLVSKGVSTTRITAKGYGASKPVAPNGTEEGRQRNRRTEFRIISRS
ncbi:MAG: OmpA family protein [Ignavibacteriota bacterium]